MARDSIGVVLVCRRAANDKRRKRRERHNQCSAEASGNVGALAAASAMKYLAHLSACRRKMNGLRKTEEGEEAAANVAAK